MNTTIDDKARRLVLSFTQFTGERHEVSSEDAKQCALICVDEILKESNYIARPSLAEKEWMKAELIERQQYWQKVKEKIQQL